MVVGGLLLLPAHGDEGVPVEKGACGLKALGAWAQKA